jgi:O-antigen/teichoic acid export membrane protein
MTTTTRADGSTGAAASGEHETRLARNYLAGQASHVAGVLVALGVTTVLARRLPLSEFGTYALVLSLTTYLIVLQGVVETPALKAFAEASDQHERDRAFSTVIVVYSAAGVLAAALVAALGWVLLDIWTIPAGLRNDAQVAIAALAILMLASWPARVFYDLLRGNQLFGRAAAAETVGFVGSGALVTVLVLVGAPLWLVVAAAGSGSLVTGLASALIVLGARMPYRLTRGGISRAHAWAFMGVSGWFLLSSLSSLVIYALDRTILGAFRTAATVGLYEGPVKAHHLVRDVQAVVVGPVLPAAVRFHVESDKQRQRALLLRGTRYMLAVVVPLTVVLMVLARPILEAWLGRKFGAAAPAMTILVGYWLVYANTSVGWNMLVAVGQIRRYALVAAWVAIANAALSLGLTPSLGLNGVVLGTTVPYLLALPVFLRMVPGQFGVGLVDLARDAWVPAYSTAVVVAAGLSALRTSVDLATIPACTGAVAVGLLAYWSIYYLVWLRPEEKLLMRTLARGVLRR